MAVQNVTDQGNLSIPAVPFHIEGTWESGTRNRNILKYGSDLIKEGLNSQAMQSAIREKNLTFCRPPLTEAEMDQVYRDIENHASQCRGHSFAVTPLNDLLAMPDVPMPFLVEDFLYRGNLSVLSARPKVGKSTLARHLATQISQGKDFLGRKTIQSKVLYLALEEHPNNVIADFRIMGGESPASIRLAGPPKDRSDLIEQIRRLVAHETPDLVIIDTMIHIINVRDLNDYTEVMKSLAPLLEIARGSNAHIVLIHHSGKGGGGSRAVLGSTAITGIVDATWTLEKDDSNRRTISSEQRLGVAFDGETLVFDPSTKHFTLGSSQPTGRNFREEIADLLSTGSMVTRDYILKRIGGKAALVGQALNELVRDHLVAKTGSGSKGDPHLFSLAPSSGVESTC